ncbi:MAG: GNAT family N-acetyltransferase [Oscillospiraceae bacterium]|jgi:predicted GNAT family acetyltransferase
MELQQKPGHVFLTDSSGKMLAEVTFPTSGDGFAVIDHTFVDTSLRGQGIAEKLLSAAVQQIRSSSLKARPTCSYAIKWFERHPEHSDLLE